MFDLFFKTKPISFTITKVQGKKYSVTWSTIFIIHLQSVSQVFFLFFGHEITITISRGLVRCTPQSPVLYFPKGINQRRWSQKKGIDDKFSNYASLKLAKAESMMNSFILPPLALLSGLLEFSFGAKGIYRGQLKLITRQCIGHRELTYNFHLRNHPSFNRSLWHCHHKILPSNINYLIY